METEKQYCVFTYFNKDTFQGFRIDSFGHFSPNKAKVYTYSPEQVAIIKDNVMNELSHSGSGFLDILFGKEDELTQELKQSENIKREWGNFELRVYKWIEPEKWYESLSEGEEWKRNQIIEEMMKNEPLETYSFKVLNYEN